MIQLESRLAQFNIDSVCGLTSEDDLDLWSFDRGKTALFCVIPEVNEGFNWLAVLLYDQIRKVLYDTAKSRDDLRLEHNTRFILDEFANVALPGDFVQILSTCRKHNITMNIVLQAVSQLKALYEKEWETIIGCCDIFLYMGTNEKSTHKYISESLGRETINVKSSGTTGNSPTTNVQLAGRELMTESEVRNLPKEECLVLISGEKPIRDYKFVPQKS